MRKIRVRVEKETRIYIHNDLANAAYHLKQSVHRIEKEGEAGIALHILGALTLYAFALEAKINFLGDKLVENWNERKPYHEKLAIVCSEAGLSLLEDERPMATLSDLKTFRDIVAHGKPIEESNSSEQIVIQSDTEKVELGAPAPHDQYCTLPFWNR